MTENGSDVVINKATGLPVERTSKEIEAAPVVNKITGQQTKGKPAPKSYLGNIGGATYDVTRAMSIKDYNSFLDYGVDVRRGVDHVESRAQHQSTVEKISHGISKAGITAVGALAENTVGLLWGLGSIATGGSFYDHSFGRGIDSVNEWASEVMPNYYTRAEERADAFSLTNLTSANFWADKVANGVGYVVGSIATDIALAYFSGGTSLGLTAARYAAKFGKAAKVLSAAEKASALKNVYSLSKAAQKGKKVGKTLTEAGKLSTKLGKGGWKTAYARAENGLISAIGESNVEARQAKNETLAALTAEWLDKNEGKTVDDIPEDVMQEMQDAATNAGNTVFAINLPIVGGTNAFTIGRMLGPGYRKSVAKLAQQESKGALYNIRRATRRIDPDKPFVEAGLDGNWLKRTAYRTNKVVGEQVKTAASEAFQEGSQVFASEFSQKYYTDKYTNGPESGGLIDAMEHGLRRTIGTKEGIESMLIGAIVGGGTTTVTNVSRRLRGKQTSNQVRQANTQQALDLLNSGVLTQPLQNLQHADKAAGLVNYMEQQSAIAADTNASITDRRRAHKNFKDAQYTLYAQQANMLVDQGRMDLVMEQLDDAKDLTDEEFKKAFGYDVNQPLPEGGKAAIVDKLKDRLQKHKRTRERIDEIAPVPQPTTGLPRRLMSQEAIEQENLEIEAATFYRNSLYNRAAQIDGHTERMESIYRQMEALDGWSGETLRPDAMDKYQYDLAGRELFEDVDGVVMSPEEVSRVMSGDLIEELNKVEQGILNPLDRQEFNKLKQDYIHLAAERQAIINSYEALTGEDGPVTAEFLRLRQQQMEEIAAQQKLQNETEAIIDTAEVPDDFSTFPANATEAQKAAAKRKAEDLGKEINDLATKEYAGKTLEELSAIDRDKLAEEENGKQKVAALDVAISEATADPDNIFRGGVNTENNEAAQNYEAEQQEIQEELRNQDNAPATGEKPDDVAANERAGRSEDDSAQPTGVRDIGIVDNRNYVTDANGNLILDADGNPQRVTSMVPAINGVPLQIDFKALQNLGSGAPITFELNEELDHDKRLEQYNNRTWKTATILVKQGDKVIGYLKSYNEKTGDSSGRKQIFDALQAGKAVTAIGKATTKARLANVRNEDGSIPFRTVTDVIENPVIGIVKFPGQMEEIEPGDGFSPEFYDIAKELKNVSTANLTRGQVVVGVRAPNGTIVSISLSTRGINETPGALDRAMQLATDPTEQNMEQFRELVGTNSLEESIFIQNPETFLNINANQSLVFYSPANKSFVRIYPNQLTQLGSPNLQIELVEATEEGFKVKGKRVLEGDTRAELSNVISQKKLQVDFNKVNQGGVTFTNPMTGERQNYREYLFNQNDPVLRIDMHPDVGTHTEVGMEFSDINIEGQTKEDTNSGKPAPPPGPAPTNTTKEQSMQNAGPGPKGKRNKHKRRGARKTTTAAASPAQPTQQTRKPGTQLNLFEDLGENC